jgi:hypothetical protein
MAGLLGDSDRPGFRRLYFTRDLEYYAEFRIEDIIATESIPPEQAPFMGLEATRLTLKRDASLQYTRTHTPRPVDHWDLDVAIRDVTRYGPTRLIRTAEPLCLERLSLNPECFTQDTCVTCDLGCFISAGLSCEYGLCPGPHGGEDPDATWTPCTNGPCPDTLACPPWDHRRMFTRGPGRRCF